MQLSQKITIAAFSGLILPVSLIATVGEAVETNRIEKLRNRIQEQRQEYKDSKANIQELRRIYRESKTPENKAALKGAIIERTKQVIEIDRTRLQIAKERAKEDPDSVKEIKGQLRDLKEQEQALSDVEESGKTRKLQEVRENVFNNHKKSVVPGIEKAKSRQVSQQSGKIEKRVETLSSRIEEQGFESQDFESIVEAAQEIKRLADQAHALLASIDEDTTPEEASRLKAQARENLQNARTIQQEARTSLREAVQNFKEQLGVNDDEEEEEEEETESDSETTSGTSGGQQVITINPPSCAGGHIIVDGFTGSYVCSCPTGQVAEEIDGDNYRCVNSNILNNIVCSGGSTIIDGATGNYVCSCPADHVAQEVSEDNYRCVNPDVGGPN